LDCVRPIIANARAFALRLWDRRGFGHCRGQHFACG
jgi:hypothetical protein